MSRHQILLMHAQDMLWHVVTPDSVNIDCGGLSGCLARFRRECWVTELALQGDVATWHGL
jgi:hypothetical protein